MTATTETPVDRTIEKLIDDLHVAYIVVHPSCYWGKGKTLAEAAKNLPGGNPKDKCAAFCVVYREAELYSQIGMNDWGGLRVPHESRYFTLFAGSVITKAQLLKTVEEL